MNLTDKITAAIEQIESTAKGAYVSPWKLKYTDTFDGISSAEGNAVMDTEGGYLGPNESTAEHILRWQPGAALRLCEGARRVLARHHVPDVGSWFPVVAGCFGCGVSGGTETPVTLDIEECPELLDVAFMLGVVA